MSKVDQTVLLQ